MGRKFVSWRRVSTGKQSRSGLGLEAQKSIIEYFVNYEHGELIADYEECHTGTSLLTCTELKKAMEHCKREDACLIIAKVDRFRTVIEALQILDYMGEGNVMFCDLPTSDRFSLTLYTALAEREALLVSIRTKQALAALKARGEVKLGGASDAWRKSYEKKSKEKINEEMKQRGTTKNRRHLESRDVKAFIKVLKNVFPLATNDDNMCDWDWSSIGTKNGVRQKVLVMMRDYKDLDPTLFVKWDFSDLESDALRVKLASYISNLRKSVKCYDKNN